MYICISIKLLWNPHSVFRFTFLVFVTRATVNVQTASMHIGMDMLIHTHKTSSKGTCHSWKGMNPIVLMLITYSPTFDNLLRSWSVHRSYFEGSPYQKNKVSYTRNAPLSCHHRCSTSFSFCKYCEHLLCGIMPFWRIMRVLLVLHLQNFNK